MDGASYFTVYYKILLPLLKPAIVTCAILKGVGVYNEYYAANLYLQDANLKTIAIALYSFTGPMGSKYNLICAGVIITLLPMLILFLIFQKQIYATFEEEPLGPSLLPLLGANNFMWASDYPHPDSTFPNSAHAIAEAFGHLDAAFVDRVTRTNCATLYRFAA